jgi:DNA-binding GntR family transcriptional regulator
MAAIGTLKNRAYDHLRKKVATRQYPADGRISEWAVSRELGMSRGPVREAINQLLTEGLLVQQPGIGTFVNQPDQNELDQLCDIRLSLEVLAVGKAARRITRRQATRLEALCRQLEELGLAVIEGRRAFEGACLDEMFTADYGIHQTILEAARAPLVHRMVKTTQVLSLIKQRSPEALARQVRDMAAHVAIHRAIVNAVIAKDAKNARRLMRDHLRDVKRELLELNRGVVATKGESNILAVA